MKTRKSTTRTLGLALALFSLSLAASAQSAARTRIERSAGWGTDTATGAIAIEASLLVLYDQANKTLVINPNYFNEAVAETQALVLGDGRWQLPDGNVIKPLVGTEAMVLGDEPAGLLEASGLPAVAYSRVSLVDRVGIAAADPSAARFDGGAVLIQAPPQAAGYALKVKHSKRCAGCSDGCGFFGCQGGRDEFVPIVFGRGHCEFKLFHRCREEFKPACRVDVHQCAPCAGAVIGTWDSYDWYCYGGC